MQAITTTSPSDAGTAARWSVDLSVGAAGATGAAQRRHGHGRHHHHVEDRDPPGRGRDGSAASAELRVKIQQTFDRLATSGDAADSGAAGGGSVSATLKAQLRGVADGGIDARVKISLKLEGSGDAAAFGQALQQLTQAVFGALQTMFAGSAPLGSGSSSGGDGSTDGTTGDGGAAAVAATNAAAAGAASTGAAGSTSAAATPATATAPSTAPTAAPGSTTLATNLSTPVSTPTPTATAAPSGSASISIRLRLAYGGFESSVPTLLQQLAQTDATTPRPDLQSMLDDMRAALQKLWSFAPQGGAQAPTLAGFLTALGRSYANGSQGEAPTTTPTSAPGALLTVAA